MKTYTYNEWKAKAAELFGKDPDLWRFVCPACGHRQSIQEFLALGHTRSEATQRVHFSCIGRWTGKDGPGCDWTLGGLMSIHEVEVLMPEEEGKKIMAFEFDEPGAGPEEPFNGKTDREVGRQGHEIAQALLHFVLGPHSPLNLDTVNNDLWLEELEDDDGGLEVWERFSCECDEIVKKILKGERICDQDVAWECMMPFYAPEDTKREHRYESRFRLRRRSAEEDGAGKVEWEWEIRDPKDDLFLCGYADEYPAKCEDQAMDAWNEKWYPEEDDSAEEEELDGTEARVSP